MLSNISAIKPILLYNSLVSVYIKDIVLLFLVTDRDIKEPGEGLTP